MKKQLCYKQTPVNIGDVVDINGINITISQSILDLNPDLFEPLLGYVKLLKYWSVNGEYLGEIFKLSTLDNLSKFQNAPSKEIFREQIQGWIAEGYFEVATKEDFDNQELIREAIKRGYDKCPKYLIFPWQEKPRALEAAWVNNEGFNLTDEYNLTYAKVRIYSKGVWAEIVKPILTTDDGVDLFDGEILYVIAKSDLSTAEINIKNDPLFGVNYFLRSEFMYYSTKELVDKYIKENMVKTLVDYEKILLLNDNLADTDLDNDVWEMYAWLKRNEPKLYWSKVLQLIADDLNGECNLKHVSNETISISFDSYFNKYESCSWNSINTGYVQFKSKELSDAAIKIMGDKLDYIYK